MGQSAVRRTVLRMPRQQRQVRLPLLEEDGLPRLPATRADCPEREVFLDGTLGPRDCPFVSCRHHLYLDVNPETGSIKLNFADLEPDELVETCSLDVAERHGEDLEFIGKLLGLVRERIRQIEAKALARLRDALREH